MKATMFFLFWLIHICSVGLWRIAEGNFLLGVFGIPNTGTRTILSTELGFPEHRIVGGASDGCSVMIGKKKGVMTRLAAWFPSMFFIWCIASLNTSSWREGSFPELA